LTSITHSKVGPLGGSQFIYNFLTIFIYFENVVYLVLFNVFLLSQNGQIKLMLQHQIRELQVATLKNMEIYSRQIMTKANEEIAKAVKKNQEMENLLRSLETEKRFLKRIAEERGATTIALHNKLEEEKKRASMVVLNDAESCCGESEEARANKRMRRDDNLMFCSKCKTKSVGVLFLPCRHLSSCKQCEALLQTCPICGMAKKDVIELQSSISY